MFTIIIKARKNFGGETTERTADSERAARAIMREEAKWESCLWVFCPQVGQGAEGDFAWIDSK